MMMYEAGIWKGNQVFARHHHWLLIQNYEVNPLVNDT